MNERIAQLLAGKKPMGFETINFTNGAAVTLNVPAVSDPYDRPYYAIMTLEADRALSSDFKAARFREDGGTPTTAIGMLLANGAVYQTEGYDQLTNFKIIGIEAAVNYTINVTYYKLGDQ